MSQPRRVRAAAGVAVVLSVILGGHLASTGLFAQDGTKSQVSIEKAFPNSSKCKRCHERVFEEWETSPLSRSIHSPAFRTALDEYVQFSGGRDNALCFRCHAPHVREFPDHAKLFLDQVKSGEPAIDGVACAQCHLIKHVDRAKHPPEPKYDIGSKVLYGPYKDFVQNLAHQSMDLDLFRKSDLCLNCHQSVPSATNLGKTNDLNVTREQTKAVKTRKESQS